MPLLRHMNPHPTERPRLEQQVRTALPTFKSVEKTLAEVVGLLMKNERLCKLLYYTDRHAEQLPPLTQDQIYSMLNEQIKIVPKLDVDPDVKPYVIVTMDNFTPALQTTDFRTSTLSFSIISLYDYWVLDDFRLRPYAIAGEIDGMINNHHLQSRVADFMGAKQLLLNPNLGGVSLYYNLETFFDDRAPLTGNQKGRVNER